MSLCSHVCADAGKITVLCGVLGSTAVGIGNKDVAAVIGKQMTLWTRET